MSANLADAHCARVGRDAARLAADQRARLSELLPDWRIVSRDGIERLERTFRFENFAQGIAFANRVGADADAEDHHPALTIEWGRVTVSWWTHVVHGLHHNDVVMAAHTDAIYALTTS